MSKQPTRADLIDQIHNLSARIGDINSAKDSAERTAASLADQVETVTRERDRALEIVLRQAEIVNAKMTVKDIMDLANHVIFPLLKPLLTPPEQAPAAE